MTHPNVTTEAPNPSGLCLCGCGSATRVAKKTNRRTGDVKDEPRRYIKGHARRLDDTFYRVCEVCGARFRRRVSNANRFCSTDCERTPPALIPHPTMTDVLMVPLTQGKFALIDCDDAAKVGALRWGAHQSDNRWYARNRTRRLYLHRHILEITDPEIPVDHENGDGLDCRRLNIRVATHSLNVANADKRPGCNPFKGITANGNGWSATITVDYATIYLGTFDVPEDAARAYDRAAMEHFGEFARLNFPD